MLAGKGLAAAEASGGWDLLNATPLSKALLFDIAEDATPSGVFFKSDGTAMYVVGNTTDSVYQYTLGTAWDLSTASYASKSFLVSGQELVPQDVFFTPDGTTMYIVGTTNDTVYQYTLSTAWDVSTASYASKSFSVAGQETIPNALFFKSDGTAMYVVGQSADRVFQYTLSTAWDVSTASYASKSFLVSGQDSLPHGVFFKPDGLVMYVAGQTNSAIFQYALGTAWDVSTASYVARSSNIGAGLAGLYIKGDGDVLYFVNSTADSVYQYPFYSAWNIASASYTLREFYTTAQQATGLTGVFLSPDGLSMYVTGIANDTVYQYTLATAGDVYTASYTGKSASVGSQETLPYGLSFSSDGTAMFVVGRTAGSVFQYTLSTAWDVSTASYASKSFSVVGQESNTSGLFFRPDGLAMYIVGVSSDTVFQYTLSTAWDVSTASYASKSFSVAGQDTAPQGLFFKSDGLAMYVVGAANDTIYQYTLSTAWDVSTASYASILLSVSAQDANATGLFIDSAGTSLYVAGNTNNRVSQFTLPTAWSLVAGWSIRVGLGSYYNSAVTTAQDGAPADLFFKSDGTAMYVVGAGTDRVYQYALSTAWDASTASYQLKNFSIAAQETNPSGLFFKPDGTTMYIVGTTNDTVYQYTLSTAWDVSTASYASKSFSVAGQETVPNALFFKSDGTTMYILGNITDAVLQYTLSTAWDVSTASYASKSFTQTQENIPTGMFFKPDGLVVYIVGSNSDVVFQYNLGTAWDISTASYSSISYGIGAYETVATGLSWKLDGNRMYIFGTANDTVSQFNTQ
jgi:sugar lactone lactonase YvrE